MLASVLHGSALSVHQLNSTSQHPACCSLSWRARHIFAPVQAPCLQHQQCHVVARAAPSASSSSSSTAVPSQTGSSATPTGSAASTGPAGLKSSAGRMTYKPASFGDMVDDAVRSVLAGIEDGLTKMEVEFPPVPVALDGYKGASDVFIDSNVQLALAAAKRLAAAGRRVHVVMPDQGEYDRTYKMFKPTLQLATNVSLGHLGEAGGIGFSLAGLFGGAAPASADAGAAADTVLIINATAVELSNVEKYGQAAGAAGKVVVLWNLELDSLRGDLGMVPYPSKDVHYKYLAYFKPVFYLRPRDYSKTVAVAPYVVNYSGALFREYPGPWQAMLRQDNGEYACIAEDQVRYNLGDLKEELISAMGINTEEEGSAMQFLRRGYKTSTWWEDDYELEASHEWRL